MKRISLTLAILLCLAVNPKLAIAQENTESPRYAKAVIKTFPFRYLYGANLGLDLRVSESLWVGTVMQHHQRDILFLRHNLPFPGLYDVDGYAITVRIMFQSYDYFFHGPEVGVKTIVGNALEQRRDFDPIFEDRKKAQSHIAYTLGLRKQTRGLGIELYGTVGLKYAELEREYFREQNGQLESMYGQEKFKEILPYVLAGFAVSFGW